MHVYFNGLDGKPLAEFWLEDGEVAGGEAMVYFAGNRLANQPNSSHLRGEVVVTDHGLEGDPRTSWFWVGPDGGGRWRVQMRLVGVG